MKKLLMVLLAGLLVVAVTAPALAFEFSMKGEYENRFRYFGRTGPNDLYGISTLQDGALGDFVGFAGPNIYGTGYTAPIMADSSAGIMRITRGGFSRWGSDALYNDSRLTLRPVFRVNPAIRVHGVYTVGGMRNKYRQTGVDAGGNGVGVAPLERYYMSQSSVNAYDGTFGTWEQFRATITMPWAVWSIGLKDFPLGTGATLAENTRAESFLWVVPYGPFRFLAAVWLARGRYLESWSTVPDGDTKPEWFNALIMTYDAGEFSAGAGAIWRFDHRGAGAIPAVPNYGTAAAPLNGVAASQVAQDDATWINLAYFKYNNGRFFANAEYAWVNLDRYYPNGTRIPLHVECNHFFSEAGFMAGPTKLSLMYAAASGPVGNNGNASKVYFGFPINYQAMEPYEFLMFNTFGGGNQGGWAGTDVSFTYDEHGMMSDAFAYAARLDYAVAANLNVYASYIWAHRLEAAGFLAGGENQTGSGVAAGAAFMAQYGGTSPYIPDGYLGWEANLGCDWKLLEGLTFKTRYSYWQPGDWFKYAYQSIGPNAAGATVRSAITSKDAINAFQGSVMIEF